MSRSNLRLGASEGESDALFGKGSGSNGHLGRRRPNFRKGDGERAKKAVTLELFDPHRHDPAEDIAGCHDMDWLQIGTASDDLTGNAALALEQHVHCGANRRRV